MATVDELLGLTDVINEVLVIDNNLRTITIPSSITNIGVESDDDVTRLYFSMPRYYNEFDLSQFEIRINCRNARGEGDSYKVTDTTINDDTIAFSWLVSRFIVAYAGNVKFNVCLRKITGAGEDAVVEKEFNTTIATLPVLTGLETTEQVVQMYPDLVQTWQEELFGRFNGRIDPTLSVSGQAADAAVVGNTFDAVSLKKASFYRNVAEMKADRSLKPGMTAVVLGYYEANDGGAAEYHIGESGNLALDNGLRAQIVIKPQMAVECFGAKGDGKTDDSSAIKEASSYDTLVMFKNKTYLISKIIDIENDIHWVGSDTKIKIADNITIDENKRYIIRVSGGTNVEGISIDYCSSYTSNSTKPAITLFKIIWDSTNKRIGKKHTLKNVNINVTEANGIKAEIMPVWYDIVKKRKPVNQGGGEDYDDVIRDFHAINCNISNLTTGRPTGTGCLWTTGIKGNIVVENCKFTRSHRGELLVFWVGDGNINNILVDNCEFNATNDIKSSAAIFGVGASVKHPTSANNVSVNNTIFNIGKGSGAACIQCTYANTTVNINNCKFIKNVPIDPDEVIDQNNEAEIMHKRRLSIALMEEGSIINFYNCYFNNVYSNLHLCETRNASGASKLCEMNVFNSSINAYNFIYNMSSNSNFYNTNISTEYATGRFMTSSDIQTVTSFKNCRLDCGILNSCSMTMLDSECFKEITNDIKTTNLNIMMMNNTLKDVCSINTSSDVLLNSLIMTDNLIHSLNIIKNEGVVDPAYIHVIANEVFCINNCDTVNNVLLPNSDRSRMVEGTGLLTISSSAAGYINSADYEYQKIGGYVNVHVYVDFKASTPPNGTAFTLKGLPYSCGNLVNPRSLCVTTQKKQMIAAMNTGSSALTIICTSADSFVENEKLSFLFRYKIA